MLGELRGADVRGITLVEVVIASLLAGLVVIGLVSVFSGAFDVGEELDARRELRRDGATIADLLALDVLSSTRVIDASLGSLVLLRAPGDSVSWAWGGPGLPLTRRASGAVEDTLAASADSVAFELLSVVRPFTSEKFVAGGLEVNVAKFEEGDWDDYVASTSCVYGPRGNLEITGFGWAAEEFIAPDEILSFERVILRIAAIDEYPLSHDVRLEIWESDPSPPGYPLLRKAVGTIAGVSVTPVQAWHSATLTTVDTTTVAAGKRLWLLVSSSGPGLPHYAGTIEYDQLIACTTYPPNGITYRETHDRGSTWSPSDESREMFFRVTGSVPHAGLEEVVASIVDTTGLSYHVALRSGEEAETREGQISLQDL